MKPGREQYMELADILSKSGIDIFVLQSGCSRLMFRRREEDDPVGEDCQNGTGGPVVEVLSPLLGICGISPGDNVQPYVQVGQHVSEQDPICTIDVLDKRYSIPAGVAGVIVHLDTRAGELVEYRQRLAVIRTV